MPANLSVPAEEGGLFGGMAFDGHAPAVGAGAPLLTVVFGGEDGKVVGGSVNVDVFIVGCPVGVRGDDGGGGEGVIGAVEARHCE